LYLSFPALQTFHQQRKRNRRRNYPHRDNVVYISDSDNNEFDFDDITEDDLPELVEVLLHQMRDFVESTDLTTSESVKSFHHIVFGDLSTRRNI
jgi:hypothetical protein